MVPRRHQLVQELRHLLAKRVINLKAHMRVMRKRNSDGRARVEGVGIVLTQRGLPRSIQAKVHPNYA